MENSIFNMTPAEILALTKEEITSLSADDLAEIVAEWAYMTDYSEKARNAINARMEKLGFSDINQRHFLRCLFWFIGTGNRYDEIMALPVRIPCDKAIIDAHSDYVTISVFPAVDINTVLARYDWRLCGEGTEYRNSGEEYGHLIQMDENQYRFEFSGKNFY